MGTFYFIIPISYVMVDFKNVVSDLFHVCYTLIEMVEHERIERKSRLSKQSRLLAKPSKPFHIQYRMALQCTTLILQGNTLSKV